MKKEIKTLALAMILVALNAVANQITGQFTYSSTGFSLGGIPSDPEEVQQPAYFIFDVQKQEIKIFNYLDSSLSHSFDQHRVFQVSRRSTSKIISTTSQLFDFENTTWEGNKILDLGDGMVFNRYFTLQEDGDWFASENGGLSGAGVSGSGHILSYSEFTPTLPTKKVEIIQRNQYLDIRYEASLGYSQKLHVSHDLSEWNEVSNTGWNPLEGNAYVSSLFKSYEKADMPSRAFFRVTTSPLTFQE
jgi:hypothetical protein